MITLILTALLANQEVSKQEIVQVAKQTHDYLYNNIQDYTGILVKREFVDGRDTGHQYIEFKLRENPLAIYIKFLKPTKLQNREVLYLGDDELLVKRGGRRNPNLTLVLSVDSPLVTDGHRYNIKEMGLRKLADKLLDQIGVEIQIPDTDIKVYRDAKLDGHPITLYRMIHHTRTPEATCRIAEIAICQELKIPIYYRALDWSEPPIVIEEYAFKHIKLNVGLQDIDFKPDNPQYGFQHQE